MAIKKIETVEEVKDNKELDVQKMMEQMKKDLMKELDKRTEEIKKKEEELKKKEEELSIKAKSVSNKIDEDREVMVRAVAYGTTTLRGRDYDYPFSGFGDELPISIKELKYMKNSIQKAFTKPMVIIEDEEASKILGLIPLYKQVDFLEDIEDYCSSHTDKELIEALLKVPQFIRIELFNRLIDLWNRTDNTQFRDYELARILRKHFKFDLISYEKEVEEKEE